MCVIAFSPKGVEAPTEEQIRAMFMTNPDGAGFAYNGRNGEVYFEKGFMTVNALLDRLKPLDQWTNTNLGIHFRIGTAGKNDEKTCHPFPISTELGELRKTSGTGSVLFHNGILQQGGWADALSSDTQDFVIAFAPLLAKPSKSKVRDKWIEDIVRGNRLLTMYKNNKYKMYGDWKKDGNIFVSNLNYQYNMYSNYYGYSYGYSAYDDEDYASYWNKPKNTTTTIATKHWRKNPLTLTYGYFTDEEIAEAEKMLKDIEEQEQAEFERIVDEYDKPTKKLSIDDELYLADQLYEELTECGYLEVTQAEADIMFKYADSKCGNYIRVANWNYLFDKKSMSFVEVA